MHRSSAIELFNKACRDQADTAAESKKGEKAELIRGEVEQLDRISLHPERHQFDPELIESVSRKCENDEIKIADRLPHRKNFIIISTSRKQVEIYLNRKQ